MNEKSTGTAGAAAADAPTSSPAPAPERYEPPAVAWEEKFDQLVAGSCGYLEPFACDRPGSHVET